MEYSLVLDKPKSIDPTYIFVLATCADGRLKKSLKERILPVHWSAEFSLPLPVKDKTLQENYKAIERKLTRIKDALDDLARTAKREGTPVLKREFADLIDELLGKVKKTDLTDYYEVAGLIMKDMEDGLILTPKGKRYSDATMVHYRQSIRVLKAYRPSFRIGDITLDFYNGWVQNMFKDDLALSSCGTHIKCVKRILDIAHQRGWHQNLIYKDKRFKTLDELTDQVHLTEQELAILFKKHLPNQTQQIVRDWFVLDCYTGLRISDVKMLNPGNFGKKTIVISNIKTGASVEIPIHPYVKEIFARWNGLPPKISEQEINREIKKICEVCKITETVLYSITKGGIRKDFYYKKFDMISNHTARRSFITNLRESGVPDSIVMKLTGIVKPSTLQRYDRLTPKRAAEVAATHKFFTGK